MFRVTTKRMTEEEIDKAIENLEKRGYKLLVKKQQPFHRKYFRQEKDKQYKFTNRVDSLNWIAVLVKE